MRRNLETKLAILEAQDVTIVDRRLTYFDEAVDVNRICGGAVLFPGTRLVGARTFVGPRAKVGIEGPAVLENTLIGENAEIASGYLREAVMLRDTGVGPNAHIRNAPSAPDRRA
jgi:bifunctional N-acetylglucosamine-1-phosphate-uridyltransferase/glucosamine-1-phosphate-acetyltransferase GlmU-like protein